MYIIVVLSPISMYIIQSYYYCFSAEFHIGYTDKEINGKSWYDLIHPEDLHEAKEKHIQCKCLIYCCV